MKILHVIERLGRGGAARSMCALAKYTGADAMKETNATMRASNFALFGPLKAQSEAEAEKWFPGKTLIIRPGYIVGPGDETDRFTYWPLRVERGGEMLAPGHSSDPVQIIDARDLAFDGDRVLPVVRGVAVVCGYGRGGQADGRERQRFAARKIGHAISVRHSVASGVLKPSTR